MTCFAFNISTAPSSRPLAGRKPQAFTLLELLLALAIVALIAVALSTALTVAFKARDAAMDQLGDFRQIRVAMEIIGRDMQTMLPPTGVLAGAVLATADDSGTDMDAISFFNSASPGPLIVGAGDVQQVQFAVMTEGEALATSATPSVSSIDGSNQDPRTAGPRLAPQAGDNPNGYVLVRQVNRQLLSQETAEPANQILLRHIQSFKVRLYDGTQWLDAWDSTTEDNTLPLAVEVSLQVEAQPATARASGQVGQPYTMTRVFVIPCATDPATTAQASSSSSSSSGTGGRSRTGGGNP